VSAYRVVQWATGTVGKAAIRHFTDNPAYDLVGVLVFDPDKVGRDAGEIAGVADTGVLTTSDVEAILALDADCVMYAPLWNDVEAVCRLLRSGKNVVTTTGPYFPTDANRAEFDRIEQACRDGGTSFHASGIHPGYAGDLLPLTLARIASRIDRIHVYEVVNFREDPSKYITMVGMGVDPDVFRSQPSLLAQALPHFAQSMAMIVAGLGKTIDDITAELEIATATCDIGYQAAEGTDMPGMAGVVSAGTVAAQHHTWTAWVDGAPLVVFHAIYTMGDDDIEPRWDWGWTRYRLVIEGEPPMELTLQGAAKSDGTYIHPGYTWTAMGAVNAIPTVCAAAPGVLTHLDLGTLRLAGVVRR
jgi:hypothetical protein